MTIKEPAVQTPAQGAAHSQSFSFIMLICLTSCMRLHSGLTYDCPLKGSCSALGMRLCACLVFSSLLTHVALPPYLSYCDSSSSRTNFDSFHLTANHKRPRLHTHSAKRPRQCDLRRERKQSTPRVVLLTLWRRAAPAEIDVHQGHSRARQQDQTPCVRLQPCTSSLTHL